MAKQSERLGYCPVCHVKVKLTHDDLVPWHRVERDNNYATFLEKCTGVGEKAARVEEGA